MFQKLKKKYSNKEISKDSYVEALLESFNKEAVVELADLCEYKELEYIAITEKDKIRRITAILCLIQKNQIKIVERILKHIFEKETFVYLVVPLILRLENELVGRELPTIKQILKDMRLKLENAFKGNLESIKL